MSTLESLKKRNSQCELCEGTQNLEAYQVEAASALDLEGNILICSDCKSAMEDIQSSANHWRCLNGAIWSEYAAVKVAAYRILWEIKDLGWPSELLDQIYLEDSELAIAKSTINESGVVCRDSNGTELMAGDSVTIIKDLNVKGGGFTAKRGTTVKNIVLTDDPKLIEGRVNGTKIVLVSAYLKKL